MRRLRPACTCGASSGEKHCSCRKSRALVLAAALLPLAAALLPLAGCAAPAPVLTRVQMVRVTVPAGLLSCEEEPAIGTMTMQSQVADYLVQLREAGADCRADVAAIAKIEATPGP